jgi:hypothetical protein
MMIRGICKAFLEAECTIRGYMNTTSPHLPMTCWKRLHFYKKKKIPHNTTEIRATWLLLLPGPYPFWVIVQMSSHNRNAVRTDVCRSIMLENICNAWKDKKSLVGRVEEVNKIVPIDVPIVQLQRTLEPPLQTLFAKVDDKVVSLVTRFLRDTILTPA